MSSLTSTLNHIQSLVRDFENSFVYIPGFDVYTVQRIKRGILDKAWKQLSRDLQFEMDLGADGHRHWIQLLEKYVHFAIIPRDSID